MENLQILLEEGNDISLSKICDHINEKLEESEISNKEVKQFMLEHFQDSIQICLSQWKNEYLLVFPSKLSM